MRSTLAPPSLGLKASTLWTTHRTRPCFPPGGTHPLIPLEKKTILTPLPPRTVSKVTADVTLADSLCPADICALKDNDLDMLIKSTIASLCLLLNIPIHGPRKCVAMP